MTRLVFNNQEIEIIEEEKRYFSSESKIYIDTISIEDIEKVVCQKFEGELNAFYIVKKDNTKKLIIVGELENTDRLSDMFDFLESKGIKIEEA